MADPKMVEQDLYEYLSKERNLRSDERIRYLMAIFNKHAEMDTLQHVISPWDLYDIVGRAKKNASTVSHTLKISGKQVSGNDPIHICMVESVVAYLNTHSLLKRNTGFEY